MMSLDLETLTEAELAALTESQLRDLLAVPYRAAAGQTFVAGRVAGQAWHATATAGQTFVAGAAAGRASGQ